jgi:hypothetical protein
MKFLHGIRQLEELNRTGHANVDGIGLLPTLASRQLVLDTIPDSNTPCRAIIAKNKHADD